MDRRYFIRFGIAGIGASIVAPQTVLATAKESKLAGGVYYTKDSPGRWSKKAAGHLPHLAVEKSGSDNIIEVVTGHEMKGYEHYIIKHVLLDKDYRVLVEHMFNPLQDKQALSRFRLKAYSGPVHVLSVCNKHDTWLNMIEV